MNQDVFGLLRAIFELAREAQEPWVRYTRLARRLYGSDEYTDAVKAWVSTPDVCTFVVVARWAVKLTEAGIRVAAAPPDGPPPGSGPDVAEVAAAVLSYQEGLRDIRFTVEEAHRVQRHASGGGRVVQALLVQASDERLATGTPVRYRATVSGWTTDGKIVGQEPDGARVYAALRSEILPNDIPGTLTVDRAFLLRGLQQRLAALTEMPPLVRSLLQGAPHGATGLSADDAIDLAGGLARLAAPWARFLWGPPGAGKTYCIGSLLAKLLPDHPGERHLVVAPSNRAADVATLEFLKHCGAENLRSMINDRRILRFGYPRMSDVIEDARLRGPVELDELADEEQKVSRRLREAEKAHQSEEDLSALRAEMLDVQERLREAVRQHVQGCSVVFTTSTMAYLVSESNPVADLQWDSVFVDEATMVPPAQCVYLGSLATRRFLLAGDPRQLGPVFESKAATAATEQWLKRDVFETTGVMRGVGDAHLGDGRLTLIDSQRRCSRGIWTRVQSLYPSVACNVDDAAVLWISRLPPNPHRPVVLMDTSGDQEAICERIHGSWRNAGTAKLAMEVACAAIGEAERTLRVAIISPYRAQVRELRKMLREELRAENEAYNGIDVGTVHQFQGSEADYVIFDPVDGRGRPGLGALLDGPSGMRLVNVAVTRARGKVVIIADRTWMRNAFTSEQNQLLWDLTAGSGTDGVLVVNSPSGGPVQQHTESPIEKLLLDAMREHPELDGIKTQHRILDEGGALVSRADFAFPDIKYAVYCDGAQWHLREARWQRDIRQRNRLTKLGWAFSVFTGSDVTRRPAECAEEVLDTYRRLHARQEGNTDPE